jgi:ATP-binding cassette, subfamily B, multidrug efflux pump
MYSVNTSVGFAIALGFMLHLSPRLTLYAMVPMVLLPPIMIGFGRAIHRRFERIQAQYSTLSNMVQENLTGVRIVRAYGQEDAQAAEFDTLNREYRARNMLLARVSGLLHPLLGLLTGVALVLVLWIGGVEVVGGRMSVGDYVAFFFYLGFLVWPMIALGWVVNLFQRGAASMARLDEILATSSALPRPSVPASTARVSGEIEFRGVSFRYPGTERWVLEDVSFVARAGETVALVGPTGSGKSTLVSLACTTPPGARFCSMASLFRGTTRARCVTRWAWCPRTRSSSRRRFRRTSPWGSHARCRVRRPRGLRRRRSPR